MIQYFKIEISGEKQMSLQFIFGNSGSGKSDFLYDSVLKQAKENKEQQFLFIVPEQFTMQTQRELVERQAQHAIMNVDVLSFCKTCLPRI